MTLEKIKVKDLPVIEIDGGNVLKFLNSNDSEYEGFGEIYFSQVKFKKIKAWKCHTKMTMNLVVPVGRVKFVFCENINGPFEELIIGENNYKCITVKPNIWFGFQGLKKAQNLVSNFANLEHRDGEVKRLDLNEINYLWK